MADRRIALVDADAFFVAVARAVDPARAGRAPLLIVGGRPGGRGVVCSASYETRAFGVRSAMPIARALRLCPDALCVPVPREACAERSRAIRGVLARFAPVVEAASIDEWYLDLTGTEALYGHEPYAATLHRIRDAVRAETGLTVSIGGATSKLVAKLAVEHAKPRPGTGADGVCVVAPGAEAGFLRDLPLAEFGGIGPRAQGRLRRLGLDRVSDVLAHDRATLRAWLGARAGDWLHDRVRGIDLRPVQPRADRKQVSRERTFARDLTAADDITARLTELAARAAADLRLQGRQARVVTVKLRTADFTTRTASRTLDAPVSSDRAVRTVAASLLGTLRRSRRDPVRLLGVALRGLAGGDAPGPTTQLALFNADAAPVERARDRAVSAAVDRVRARFGDGAIGTGAPPRRRR